MLPKFIMCNLLRWFCFPDSMLCSVILNNLVCTDKVDSERALENLAYDENYAISQIKSGYSQYRIVYCVAKGVYFGISLAPFSKRYLPFIKPTVKWAYKRLVYAHISFSKCTYISTFTSVNKSYSSQRKRSKSRWLRIRAGKLFSVKCQRVKILAFVSYTICVTTTQLCCGRRTIDHIWWQRRGCLLVKLHLLKPAAGQIWLCLRETHWYLVGGQGAMEGGSSRAKSDLCA